MHNFLLAGAVANITALAIRHDNMVIVTIYDNITGSHVFRTVRHHANACLPGIFYQLRHIYNAIIQFVLQEAAGAGTNLCNSLYTAVFAVIHALAYERSRCSLHSVTADSICLWHILWHGRNLWHIPGGRADGFGICLVYRIRNLLVHSINLLLQFPIIDNIIFSIVTVTIPVDERQSPAAITPITVCFPKAPASSNDILRATQSTRD